MPLAWEAYLKDNCENCNTNVRIFSYNIMRSQFWCQTCWKRYNRPRVHSWRYNNSEKKEFERILKQEKDFMILDEAIEEARNCHDLQWFKKLMHIKNSK